METAISLKPRNKRKKWLIALIILIVFLIIARIILPYFVLKYVNKTLSELKEYRGHVEDIDIALIRGAYQIIDIRIDKIDSVSNKVDTIPFFKSSQIDLSVQWSAIFKGAVVGEIYVTDPVLNFVKGKHKKEDVKADTADFRTTIDKLMPLTINHFEIENGQIHYIDKYSTPHVDIAMTNLQVKADNLSNVNDSAKLLPAKLIASGDVYNGRFDLNVDFNALEKQPTFDLNAGLKNIQMVSLNDFFKAYANFQLDQGNLGLYTEFAAKNGNFKGYVKPIIKDLKVKKEGDFLDIVWENIVAGAATILENRKKDQVATKVPIEGRFDQPDTDLWTAINYVLRNAFVYALKPSIDNEINIGKIEQVNTDKTLLQKIFGKKDKDKDEEKE
ncbi:MAG TPA: DUF748 domain-containing protein [Bacteroidia bacterium]|nr:DUF748 domain-containing protein [Bacteroidia bacterium]